jgi:hypothetical protein
LPGCAKSIAYLVFDDEIGFAGEIAGSCGKSDLAKKHYHNRAALCPDSFWVRFGPAGYRGMPTPGFARRAGRLLRGEGAAVASMLFPEWSLTGWAAIPSEPDTPPEQISPPQCLNEE